MPSRAHGDPRDGLVMGLAVVLVALLVVGGAAAVLAAVREHEDAQQNERENAELVRTEVAASVDQLSAALAGAGTVVGDGQWGVSLERWQVFATEAANQSAVSSLTLVVVVNDADRAAFEATIGGPILQARPDGSLAPAPREPTYLAAMSVVPENDENRRIVGFDISSESTRGDAAAEARNSGEMVITSPVRGATTGLPTFFVVKPLYRLGAPLDSDTQRSDALVGYVTTGLSGPNLVDVIEPRLPSGTRFTIQDGDVVVASTEQAPRRAETASVNADGREWTLIVDDGKKPNYSLAWLIGVATVVITAAVAFVLWGRMQVHRQRVADTDRHARSADLAQHLAEARTTAAVGEAVTEELPPLLHAANATIRMLDDSGQVLQAVNEQGLPPPVVDVGDQVADDSNPAGRAVRERTWVLIENLDRQHDHEGPLIDALRESGYRALAALPLEVSDGTVVGVLGVAWDVPHPFDETTLALLRTVVELCEQTIERSRLHDSEHLLVERLQTAALSPPSSVKGLEMSVRYRSAVQTLTMGGDWYDTVVLDPRRVALVVGDVAGHGVPAIAEMIELRSAIHALLLSEHPIDQVMSFADAILSAGRRTRIATALVAVFDSGGQTVQYVFAGHPPALLRDIDGRVEVLMDGRRPVLGVPPHSDQGLVARRPFPEGSTFVAYTDGLVERRREDLLVSIDRLAAELSPTNLRGEQLADAILDAHGPDETSSDDIALVVVQAT